jgi:hypothetical protein
VGVRVRRQRPAFGVEWVYLRFPGRDNNTLLGDTADKNMRPSLPQSTLVNSQLTSIIYASWDRDPLNRPSFEQISHKLNEQRADRELSEHQLADADI